MSLTRRPSAPCSSSSSPRRRRQLGPPSAPGPFAAFFELYPAIRRHSAIDRAFRARLFLKSDSKYRQGHARSPGRRARGRRARRLRRLELDRDLCRDGRPAARPRGRAGRRAVDLAVAALHRPGQGRDDRPVRGRHRCQRRLQRGDQRQRRVLRQDPAAADRRRVGRPRPDHAQRLAGGEDVRPGLHLPARQGEAAERREEPDPGAAATRPRIRIATSPFPGRPG